MLFNDQDSVKSMNVQVKRDVYIKLLCYTLIHTSTDDDCY